jgi:hypothetical protein
LPLAFALPPLPLPPPPPEPDDLAPDQDHVDGCAHCCCCCCCQLLRLPRVLRELPDAEYIAWQH